MVRVSGCKRHHELRAWEAARLENTPAAAKTVRLSERKTGWKTSEEEKKRREAHPDARTVQPEVGAPEARQAELWLNNLSHLGR